MSKHKSKKKETANRSAKIFDDIKGKRGTRIYDEDFTCSRCLNTFDEGWRYNTSPITYLCNKCKERLRPSDRYNLGKGLIFTPM